MTDELWNHIPGMREFWPVYQAHHSHSGTRAMHDIGGFIVLGGLGAALGGPWWLFPCAVAVAYGFAFSGHWMFEHNTPLTFQRPLMAAAADIRMFFSSRVAELSRARLGLARWRRPMRGQSAI